MRFGGTSLETLLAEDDGSCPAMGLPPPQLGRLAWLSAKPCEKCGECGAGPSCWSWGGVGGLCNANMGQNTVNRQRSPLAPKLLSAMACAPAPGGVISVLEILRFWKSGPGQSRKRFSSGTQRRKFGCSPSQSASCGFSSWGLVQVCTVKEGFLVWFA